MGESDGPVESEDRTVEVTVLGHCYDHLGELFHLAGSAHGSHFVHRLLDLLRNLASHRGGEDAGGNGDDSYVHPAQVSGHGHGHSDNGSLGGTVHGLSSLSLQAGYTGHIDDDSILLDGRVLVLLDFLLAHHLGGVLGYIEGAHDIDLQGLHHEFPLGDSLAAHQRLRHDDASTIHHDVDLAVLLGHLLHHTLHILLGGHVALHEGTAVLFSHLLASLADVDHDDLHSLLDQPLASPQAQAGRAACHDSHLSLEFHRYVIYYRPSILHHVILLEEVDLLVIEFDELPFLIQDVLSLVVYEVSVLVHLVDQVFLVHLPVLLLFLPHFHLHRDFVFDLPGHVFLRSDHLLVVLVVMGLFRDVLLTLPQNRGHLLDAVGLTAVRGAVFAAGVPMFCVVPRLLVMALLFLLFLQERVDVVGEVVELFGKVLLLVLEHFVLVDQFLLCDFPAVRGLPALVHADLQEFLQFHDLGLELAGAILLGELQPGVVTGTVAESALHLHELLLDLVIPGLAACLGLPGVILHFPYTSHLLVQFVLQLSLHLLQPGDLAVLLPSALHVFLFDEINTTLQQLQTVQIVLPHGLFSRVLFLHLQQLAEPHFVLLFHRLHRLGQQFLHVLLQDDHFLFTGEDLGLLCLLDVLLAFLEEGLEEIGTGRVLSGVQCGLLIVTGWEEEFLFGALYHLVQIAYLASHALRVAIVGGGVGGERVVLVKDSRFRLHQ